MGGGEGVDGFGGGEGLLAEGCGFAARWGVEYGDAVGKGGDAGVAAGGGGGGGAADAVGEGGVGAGGGRRRGGRARGGGVRMAARARAGQIMTDGDGGAARPGWCAGWRRRSSRNSFSMGDWKPLMKVAG